uniref:Uncharacterized protein n=1 Tax=Molossus molossus TaxID=27622 RepID=A0A7J8J1K0_MOLMO|nr:hypothetical protein HJG59_010386 [Molossus molossus]
MIASGPGFSCSLNGKRWVTCAPFQLSPLSERGESLSHQATSHARVTAIESALQEATIQTAGAPSLRGGTTRKIYMQRGGPLIFQNWGRSRHPVQCDSNFHIISGNSLNPLNGVTDACFPVIVTSL